MKNSKVRLTSITLENFKNVTYGHINLKNPRKNYAASILGLYGQNGSGKTAMIDAVSLLKQLLCGQAVPISFADCVKIDAEKARLTYELEIENTLIGGNYIAHYEVSLKKASEESQGNSQESVREERYKAVLFNEILSFSYESQDEKRRMAEIINTSTADVFGPKTKYEILVGKKRELELELLVIKKIAETSSRSFLFSKELMNAIRKNCRDEKYLFALESLINFGNFELFVINSANSGLINMNALPLSFKYEGGKGDSSAVGTLMLPLNHPAVVPEMAVSVVKKVINSMNLVLTQLIPGLTIGVYEIDKIMSRNNTVQSRIQLVSNRNGRELPLQYESDGIKKIISILQLLIVVYNQASITVAIDELDSGIFEYLLGEILRIISEKGKGQLIFTSHNLRPLETLDRGFIAFTTTNPENCYIRFSNVKTNNNLRDFYYRDILLGEQSEIVYEPTNNYEIAYAFREAGEGSGS